MTKKKVERVECLNCYSNFAELKKTAEGLKELHNLSDGDLTITQKASYGDSYDLVFEYYTEETDSEYQKRLEVERQYQQRRRQDYERLKKEFEGK